LPARLAVTPSSNVFFKAAVFAAISGDRRRRAAAAEDERNRRGARDAHGDRARRRNNLVFFGRDLVRAGARPICRNSPFLSDLVSKWRLFASESIVTFAPSTGLPARP
jgi:hypothetical protein